MRMRWGPGGGHSMGHARVLESAVPRNYLMQLLAGHVGRRCRHRRLAGATPASAVVTAVFFSSIPFSPCAAYLFNFMFNFTFNHTLLGDAVPSKISTATPTAPAADGAGALQAA